jgi:hypothetical protein
VGAGGGGGADRLRATARHLPRPSERGHEVKPVGVPLAGKDGGIVGFVIAEVDDSDGLVAA